MTQIVMVSANTAALNMEALKPARRLATAHRVADTKAEVDRDVRRAENADEVSVEHLVPATSVSIDLEATLDHPSPQTTLAQAKAAYRALDD